ncbi:MAG: hypothetical protein RL562_3477 [Planctomycetota bacterium]
MRVGALLAVLFFLSDSAAPLRGQILATAPDWRALGPGNMSGRIVDLAVDPTDTDTWYAASASGGLFRTDNQGTTWTPVFDREATISLGSVAVSPSTPDTVWVGTGEANARNSASFGNGVYVSHDRGQSWAHKGLDATFQIGRIAVHPKDASVVLVAACGRLWGPNPERGVFRTTDGGSTWQHVLSVDEDTGAVDVTFDPNDPSRVLAATWTRRRGPYDSNDPDVRFGKGAGIWRSTDSGASWSRVESGLPTCRMGRIGLTVCASKPDVCYAILATERLGEAMAALEGDKTHPFAERLGGQVANIQDKQGAEGFEAGGVYRSDDGGASWRRVNSLNPRPYYYSQIRVDPSDPERVYVLGTQYDVSTDGGKTFTRISDHGLHVDFHALWIDPSDPERLLLGCDAGVQWSVDRGDTWRHFRNLPCAQYYRVAVDDREPYRIYGGLQDNGSWVVPSRSWHREGVMTDEVFCIGWGDGFTALPHPTKQDLVYASSQNGSIRFSDYRGQSGGVARPEKEEGDEIRFQWDTPYLFDPIDPDVLWVGAHRVIRAEDGGRKAEWRSPVLAATAEGAITALRASTKLKNLLWAGTADGRVWVTRNAGKAWKDVTADVPDLPGPFHTADIEPSHADAGTAWLAFDGHRSDNHDVLLYRTTNFGKTWKQVGQGIDRGPVLAIQQGTQNEDLLFVGTEFGVFASIDAGDSFFPVRGNLPTVAVRDFAIQPRDLELVAGTHGRGLYTLDIAGLERLTSKERTKGIALLPPRPAVSWQQGPARMVWGDDRLQIANAPSGTAIHYWLADDVGGDLTLVVTESGGATIKTLAAPKTRGLHRVPWDLSKDEKGQVGPGDYRVQLKTGKGELEEKLAVRPDPASR